MNIIKLPLYAELEMLRRNNVKEIKNYIDAQELDNYAHDVLIEVGNIEVIEYFLGKYKLQNGMAFSNILKLEQDKSTIDRILAKAVREKNADYVPYNVRAYMQKEIKCSHDTFFNENADYEQIATIMQSFPKGKIEEFAHLLPPYNDRNQEKLSIAYENR